MLDETIDSFGTWLDELCYPEPNARLSFEEAREAYEEMTGQSVSVEEALDAMIDRYELIDPQELIFCAILNWEPSSH